MIKIKLLISLFFVAKLSLAQNAFPNTGNVGIGTSAPTYILDIQAPSSNFLRLNRMLNTHYLGLMYSTGDSFKWFTGLREFGNDNYSFFNTTKGEVVTILESGDVGFGTTAPQGRLDIFNPTNAATTPLLSLRSNFNIPGNYGMIRFGDYTQTVNHQKGAIIYESVHNSARGKFHIALENTDSEHSVGIADARLTVLSNGNVGIENLDPQAGLDIKKAYSPYTTTAMNLFYQGSWGTVNYASNYRMLSIGSTEEGKILEVNGFGMGIGYAPPTYASPDKLYVNGNVGIGTSSPKEKLSVNGKIRAHEIKVELTNWPDYVFEEDYQAQSIEEIERYIKTHKHLRDIPTAKEVAVEGASLGELNKLLLKKIEELTLLLIDQHKKITTQGQLIKKVQCELNGLKKEPRKN